MHYFKHDEATVYQHKSGAVIIVHQEDLNCFKNVLNFYSSGLAENGVSLHPVASFIDHWPHSRSFEITPWGAVCLSPYYYSIVIGYLVPFMRYLASSYGIWAMGRSRSLKMVPLDDWKPWVRFFYSHYIANTAASLAVSTQYTNVMDTPDKHDSAALCMIASRGKNQSRWAGYLSVKTA